MRAVEATPRGDQGVHGGVGSSRVEVETIRTTIFDGQLPVAFDVAHDQGHASTTHVGVDSARDHRRFTKRERQRVVRALVRAVAKAVGMYPLVGRFLPQCKAPTLATLRGERVRVHAFSVNGKLDVSTLCEPNEDGEKIATLACFDELIRGAHAVQVRECTLVVAAAVVFVCASLSVRPDEPTIDPETGEPCPRPGPPSGALGRRRLAGFGVRSRAVAQVTVLRLRLHKAFAARVEHPKQPLPPDLSEAVRTIGRVLAAADALAFIEASISGVRARGGGGGLQGRGFQGRGRGGRHGGRGRGIPVPRRP